MTQEEKQLLLVDLCARLPYRVMIKSVGENKIIGLHDLKDVDNLPLPYLRPMSSMTEEEAIYYDTFYTTLKFYQKEDWLNAHHFDYRGLIPMGLALEAPEGTYNNKTTCNNCEDKNYCSQSEYVKNNCYKLK